MRRPVLPIGSDEVIGEVEYLGEQAGDGIRPREVVVWLPPSYRHEPERRYRVLYMHDGHNLVDPTTSYDGADWQVDEVASQMIEAGRIDEFILVGPYCSDDRFEEYGTTVAGRAYLEFLVGRLKPLIDEHYRTMPNRDTTFVAGSSMGGLASLLAVRRHPDVFSAAGCLSPYLPDELITEMEAEPPTSPVPYRLYMDNGGDELDESFQPNINRALALLRAQGWEDGDTLEWFRDEGAPHHESAWSQRVWRPLEFLLGSGQQPSAG
jgi:predicted alpha/beta superfamily hydrolase